MHTASKSEACRAQLDFMLEVLSKVTAEALAIQQRFERIREQVARGIACPPSEIDRACEEARSFALANGDIVARASVLQARRGIDFAQSGLETCACDLAANTISKAQAQEVIKTMDELLRSSEELLEHVKAIIGRGQAHPAT